MKKILALILVIISAFGVTSCGKNKYKPVKSTDEEARTVMTLEIGKNKYEVKYELYRALFLSYKVDVDGGDGSVWSGSDAGKYVDEINSVIKERASQIFAAFALAEELGIDPYSKDMERELSSFIKMSVEGNGADVEGFGGDYDAYLASLKAQNLNYSVQTLMLRYSLLIDKINEYYFGVEDQALGYVGGKHEFTKDDVKRFYESDECARVFHAFIGKTNTTDAKQRINSLRDKMTAATSDVEIALAIINNTAATPTELLRGKDGISGIVVGKSTVADGYGEYRDTAFSLAPGEISEVIEVGGREPGYFLIYVIEKDSEHFDACYETVKLAYLDNVIGEKLSQAAKTLSESAEYSKNYEEIEHGKISMD